MPLNLRIATAQELCTLLPVYFNHESVQAVVTLQRKNPVFGPEDLARVTKVPTAQWYQLMDKNIVSMPYPDEPQGAVGFTPKQEDLFKPPPPARRESDTSLFGRILNTIPRTGKYIRRAQPEKPPAPVPGTQNGQPPVARQDHRSPKDQHTLLKRETYPSPPVIIPIIPETRIDLFDTPPPNSEEDRGPTGDQLYHNPTREQRDSGSSTSSYATTERNMTFQEETPVRPKQPRRVVYAVKKDARPSKQEPEQQYDRLLFKREVCSPPRGIRPLDRPLGQPQPAGDRQLP
jgi:hypothetical protein